MKRLQMPAINGSLLAESPSAVARRVTLDTLPRLLPEKPLRITEWSLSATRVCSYYTVTDDGKTRCAGQMEFAIKKLRVLGGIHGDSLKGSAGSCRVPSCTLPSSVAPGPQVPVYTDNHRDLWQGPRPALGTRGSAHTAVSDRIV